MSAGTPSAVSRARSLISLAGAAARKPTEPLLTIANRAASRAALADVSMANRTRPMSSVAIARRRISGTTMANSGTAWPRLRRVWLRMSATAQHGELGRGAQRGRAVGGQEGIGQYRLEREAGR